MESSEATTLIEANRRTKDGNRYAVLTTFLLILQLIKTFTCFYYYTCDYLMKSDDVLEEEAKLESERDYDKEAVKDFYCSYSSGHEPCED